MNITMFDSSVKTPTAASIQKSLAQVRCIGPLPPALQAFVIAAIVKDAAKPVLWLMESTDEMYQAQENLAVFLDTSWVNVYPPLDVRPYQDDSPSKEIIAERINVLSRLLSERPGVVIAPFDAVIWPVIPKDELEASRIHLGADIDIDRDDLSRRLVQMGYTREALIDDIGQFSIRGSVMDIYSPGMEEPVRIDLWGDTVTSIKTFNLNTQRSGKLIPSVTILPASEVLLDINHVKNARPWLRRMKDPSMAALIGDIEQGIYPPGIEAYLTLFYEQPATVFDYLPAGSIAACPDSSILDLWWENASARFMQAYEHLKEGKGKHLPPESLLVGREAIRKGIERLEPAGRHIL